MRSVHAELKRAHAPTLFAHVEEACVCCGVVIVGFDVDMLLSSSSVSAVASVRWLDGGREEITVAVIVGKDSGTGRGVVLGGLHNGDVRLDWCCCDAGALPEGSARATDASTRWFPVGRGTATARFTPSTTVYTVPPPVGCLALIELRVATMR